MSKARKRTSTSRSSPVQDAITVRLTRGGGRVSRDDGGSADLDQLELTAMREIASQDRSWIFGNLTAGAEAILAEANSIIPRTDLWNEPVQATHHHEPRTTPASSLGNLLRKRISGRSMATCDKQDVVNLLATCYQVLASEPGPDGYPISHRPVPSAGARHPLDLILACPDVRGLPAGYYRFDPFSSSLEPRTFSVPLRAAIDAVRQAGRFTQGPAAVVFLVCDFRRTLSRYPSGSALALLDAGALAFCLHLAAVEAQLVSCIVGTSGVLSRATWSEPRQDVVALALGGRDF